MSIFNQIFRISGRSVSYRLIALIVAFNYFAFRTELYQDEYRENHPERPDKVSFTLSSLNWESFDKDNAPKAFTIHVNAPIELICVLNAPLHTSKNSSQPYQPIRDKSPPVSVSI
ncbi:MAG: hypothetical protein ACHQQQ_05615 [Bacteroidota bacterium]